MLMPKAEIEMILRVYREEFAKNFPGLDAESEAVKYLSATLESKIEKLLGRIFGFRPPLELIAFLEYLNEQKKQESEAPKRGKPRDDEPEVQPGPPVESRKQSRSNKARS